MALPHPLEHLRKAPGMYLGVVEFDVAASFVQGFSMAGNGGLLTGFREWLVVQLGYGNNLGWPELVLRLSFPREESPRKKLRQSGQQEYAVERLFEFLDVFWKEKESPHGLRRIVLRYHEWLKRQEWYDASSPDWITEEVGALRV